MSSSPLKTQCLALTQEHCDQLKKGCFLKHHSFGTKLFQIEDPHVKVFCSGTSKYSKICSPTTPTISDWSQVWIFQSKHFFSLFLHHPNRHNFQTLNTVHMFNFMSYPNCTVSYFLHSKFRILIIDQIIPQEPSFPGADSLNSHGSKVIPEENTNQAMPCHIHFASNDSLQACL